MVVNCSPSSFCIVGSYRIATPWQKGLARYHDRASLGSTAQMEERPHRRGSVRTSRSIGIVPVFSDQRLERVSFQGSQRIRLETRLRCDIFVTVQNYHAVLTGYREILASGVRRTMPWTIACE